jgi:hypothetical protein
MSKSNAPPETREGKLSSKDEVFDDCKFLKVELVDYNFLLRYLITTYFGYEAKFPP